MDLKCQDTSRSGRHGIGSRSVPSNGGLTPENEKERNDSEGKQTMQGNPQKQSVQPVDLKVDAAKEGSLSVNPAMPANAGEEIAMNNPPQVQIALGVAAAYRNGHFLLHLALLLQPLPGVKTNYREPRPSRVTKSSFISARKPSPSCGKLRAIGPSHSMGGKQLGQSCWRRRGGRFLDYLRLRHSVYGRISRNS